MKPTTDTKWSLLPLLFLSLFPVLTAPAAGAEDKLLDGLDAYVEAAMQDWGVPGAAIGVVKDDALVYARGFGVREIGKPGKVDEHTLFAVASNTKAFTAALLGMLVDEGRIRWDDRAADYLEGFQLHDPYVTREITIRDLLTHRSGLPVFGGDHLWIGNNYSRKEILHRIRYLEPSAPFRSRFQYQNIMFLAAGQVIPTVTGETWDGMVKKRIFDPLGMKASSTTARDLAGSDNVAMPHEVVDGKTIKVAFDLMDSSAPAGAVNSNVVDMAQWMRLHLGGGVYEGKRLLSEEVVREMQSIQMPVPISPSRRQMLGTRFSGYGLGWFLSDYRGCKMVSHGGGLTGMISHQALLPEKNLGVIVLTNFAPNWMARSLMYRALDALLGAEPRDWSAEYLEENRKIEEARAAEEEKLAAERVEGTRPSLELAAYAGEYHDNLSGEAAVVLEEGRLVFRYNPRYIGDLEHWHYDTFRLTWRHGIYDMAAKTFITFRLDEAGRVAELELTFYDPVTFQRVRGR